MKLKNNNIFKKIKEKFKADKTNEGQNDETATNSEARFQNDKTVTEENKNETKKNDLRANDSFISTRTVELQTLKPVESQTQNLNLFHQQKKGYLDVWWLYDDGG